MCSTINRKILKKSYNSNIILNNIIREEILNMGLKGGSKERG